VDLISGNRRVQGWSSGTATDSADAMEFAERMGVHALIENFPLSEAQAAVDRMLSGRARFRVVLGFTQN